MAEKICYALILIAFFIVVFYVVVTITAIKDIKDDLTTLKGKFVRTDNGCDICCRDCDDKDVCIGCCSHAKCVVVAEENEEGEKDYGNDKL